MSFMEKLKKKKNNSSKPKSLGDEIFSAVFVQYLVIWIIVLRGLIFVGDIPTSLYSLAIFSSIPIFGFMTILFWVAIRQITESLTEALNDFEKYETTEKERTKLVKRVLGIPGSTAALIFVVFAIEGIVWILIIANNMTLGKDAIILISVCLYMGTIFCSVNTLTGGAQKVCSRYASRIIEKGVLKEEIENKQISGLSSKVITMLHIILPIVFVNAIFLTLAWRIYVSHLTGTNILVKTIAIGVGTVCAYFYSSIILFRRMMHALNNMRNLLGSINKQSIHTTKWARTDLSNEFMYNVYLINRIILVLQKILKESIRISMDVIKSSNELSVISHDTAVTSLQQNSSIKELLSAMEETDALAKNIASKTGEVSIVAKKTTDNIMSGFDILKQNMQKLNEIKNANDITVDGIKHLTEKIMGISDIVRIINSIADQTNIIAFNAELEASRAGDAGENFAHVANEIRRLTNNTIQSTDEIRKRIKEIQKSSDALLVSSQNGSKKILDETEIINELRARFEELKLSSEAMDYASEDIEKIIDQQTASFTQIVVTLRQISQSTEMFSASTQKISDSAQNLCDISRKLEKFQPEESEVKE